MLTSIITTPINHFLRNERWACKRLQAFTGRAFCIQIPPLVNFKMLINAEGEVQQVDNSICADATLTLPPSILSRMLKRESTAHELIKIIGNKSFADELINIGRQIDLRMILEQNLSKAIGDIPAHRITNAGEHLIQWQAENLDRMSQAWVEYWTEENVLLTKTTVINQFIQEVKNLQQNTEQLEQRLNKLIPNETLTSK